MILEFIVTNGTHTVAELIDTCNPDDWCADWPEPQLGTWTDIEVEESNPQLHPAFGMWERIGQSDDVPPSFYKTERGNFKITVQQYQQFVSFVQLDPEERKLARVVEMMHKCPSMKGNGCAEYSYLMGTTGIGPTAKMQCKHCNEEWDITDYESW